MNITVQRTVNLSEPILPEAFPAPIYEGESYAHTFVISATKNKEAQLLSGSVVAFFDRPDGTTVRINGQVKDGKAYVTLTHECYVEGGAFFLRVMLLNGETQVVIYSASGRMRKKADGESIDGGSTPGGGIVPPGDNISPLPPVGIYDNGKILAVEDGIWVAKAPASTAEKDNTTPITSAAVFEIVGNINALLETI